MYHKRYLDETIQSALRYMGAVYVKGPRWCGKTTTCLQFAQSALKLGDPREYQRALLLEKTDISLLIQGESPRLIDEWQAIPQLWNAVRNDVDSQEGFGHYLLTGSVTPVFDKSMHSGAGRIMPVTMYPLSLYESGDSSGQVSLAALADGYHVTTHIESPQRSLEEIASLICRGGWPAIFKCPVDERGNIARALESSIYESSDQHFGWIKRNPLIAKTILKSCAKAISTTTLLSTIIDDVQAHFSNVAATTIRNYISDFEKLFVLRQIPGWNLAIRSRSARRAAPKRDFVDPSIATAVLDLTPSQLFNDPTFFGLLFESLVRRDLSVYIEYLGGSIMHFRNRYGLECDNVVLFKNGEYGLVEVKLSLSDIQRGIQQLTRIRSNLMEKNRKLPKFMMIITSLGDVLEIDGVLVVPIGCLRA